MIVDLHAHIGSRKGVIYGGVDIIAEMDAAGVDRACVFTQTEERDNDYTAGQAATYPDRLIGFCMIDPWAPDAESEMERCYAELGMRGVKLHPVRQGVALDRHAVVDPFLELCARYRAVFFAHGASEPFNAPGKFAEMAASHPDVAMVLGHGGTPWGLQEAIDALIEYPNLHVASALMSRPQLRSVLDQVGPSRVLLATDAPFNSYQLEIAKLREVASSEADAELMLGGNLLRLLGQSSTTEGGLQ